MKLLVTGGCGFIGSNFILYWMKKRPEDLVVNLDKLTYAGNPENLVSVENNPNYKFIKGDICDGKLVQEVIKGVDTVVHFAAESHVDRSIARPAIFIKTNTVGTQILLEAAVRNKIKRFHHISTDEVFGSLELNDKRKFSENTPYHPRSPYAASKAASDHLVNAYYYTYGLPITISNCSNNFGPYQFPEKLISLSITNILEGREIPIYGDGLNIRNWLHVEDHCRAIDLILEKGKAGETYCLGGIEDDISNLEVVRKIIKILGRDDNIIKYIKDRPGHDRKYAVDWSKIKNSLGWAPINNFDTWLIKTVDWYKQNSFWWKRLKNGNFIKYYKEQYND